MAGAFPESLVTGYAALLYAMANDPKDRHVLAAAVVGAHTAAGDAHLPGPLTSPAAVWAPPAA